MTALAIALCVLCCTLLVLVVGLLRSHAQILRALHDLGVNLDEDHNDQTFHLRGDATAPALAYDSIEPDIDLRTAGSPGIVEARRAVADPSSLGAARDISGVTAAGEAAVIGVVGSPQPTLLAFLSTGCSTCHEFWDAFGSGVSLEFDRRPVRIVAVTKGSDHESPGIVASLAPTSMTTVMSTDAYEDYGVPVAPYFVLIDAHGDHIVGEGAASSWPQLAGLLERAVADRAGALGAQRTRRELLGGAGRGPGADEALADAGIEPGDASLYDPPTQR